MFLEQSLFSESFEEKCVRLEHWETDPWAAYAVLKKELLTAIVVDCCVGTGVLARAASIAGYNVLTSDIHDWGYPDTTLMDWTEDAYHSFREKIRGVAPNATLFINPPFSLAVKFLDIAFEMGFRKIVCFQRFDWYEGSDMAGRKRGTWWAMNRPARIWVCGDRAHCHLHSYPAEKRKEGSTKRTHAFFVWERGHAPAAITGHIYKSDVQ